MEFLHAFNPSSFGMNLLHGGVDLGGKGGVALLKAS
jgi:hypothetical protein